MKNTLVSKHVLDAAYPADFESPITTQIALCNCAMLWMAANGETGCKAGELTWHAYLEAHLSLLFAMRLANAVGETPSCLTD